MRAGARDRPGQANDLETPIGQIACDASGDLKDQRIYIFQVQKVGDELQFVQVSR